MQHIERLPKLALLFLTLCLEIVYLALLQVNGALQIIILLQLFKN